MRQPVFDSPSDPDGRRARSLDLYGATASYRRDDGLGRDFAEIVRVAVAFTGAQAASLDLWDADALIRIARTPGDTALGALARVALGNRLPAAVVVVDDPDRAPAICVAAPLIGREGAPLGLLVVGFTGAGAVPESTPLLLKHLAGAAIGVLDRQRRAWERRGRPGATALRAVDGRERRAEPPDA